MPASTRGIAPLAVAVQAAIAAGDYFRSRRDSIHDVRAKTAPSDLVTDVDPVCEDMIRQHIHRHYPGDTLLGEESTAPGSAASSAATAAVWDAPHLWIVDPLDGTTNFVQGLPLSVVSVAYACSGRLQAGVVYDPYRDEVFLAWAGAGAYLVQAAAALAWSQDVLHAAGTAPGLPGRRLTASATTELRQAVVSSGFPTRSAKYLLTLAATTRLFRQVKSVRALGAAALQLAYVAAGRLDAYWEHDLNAWDMAAGVLLVQEAGGCARELGGRPYDLRVRDIVACGQAALAAAVDAVIREQEETG
ncbi:MAG: inositol monophosphatase [Alicyclobacillus sp.]|nr:inositol monophosphatase [Alicyclobacillus sp.]